MGYGWSIDGARVEIRPGLAPRVMVREAGQETRHRLRKSGVTFTAAGRELHLGFVPPAGWQLSAPGGRLPRMHKHVEVVQAPQDARCPVHTDVADRACARCGTFLCGSCAALDRTHCTGCFDFLRATEAREQMVLRVRGPVVMVSWISSSMLGWQMLLISGALTLVTALIVTRLARDAPDEKAANRRAAIAFAAAFGAIGLLTWLRYSLGL